MLGVTVFGIFLTPVFFYVINGLTDRKTRTQPVAKKSIDVKVDGVPAAS